jgi:hypothetical protein
VPPLQKWIDQAKASVFMNTNDSRKTLKSVTVGLLLGALALSALMSTGCDLSDTGIVPAADQPLDKYESVERRIPIITCC